MNTYNASVAQLDGERGAHRQPAALGAAPAGLCMIEVSGASGGDSAARRQMSRNA